MLVNGILLTAATETPHAITITTEGIIAFAALLGALATIFGAIFAVYRWYLHQKDQDKVIEKLREEHAKDNKELREEQQLLTYGILACLDGLKQLNCNGAVTEAQEKISKHLNARAHNA